MLKVILFAALTLVAAGSAVAAVAPLSHRHSVYRPPKLEIRKSDSTAKYYPALARYQGWQGSTTVNICLDANGVVTGVKVKHSSGHDLLDRAALVWITNGAVFSPGTKNGKPIAMCVNMAVAFKLSGLTGGPLPNATHIPAAR